MDGTGPMRRTPDPMEWLAINAQYADPATVPEGKVQSTQFVCERVSDGRIVGMLQVRLALNDYLLHYGGHIGYSVRPDERRGDLPRAALPGIASLDKIGLFLLLFCLFLHCSAPPVFVLLSAYALAPAAMPSVCAFCG